MTDSKISAIVPIYKVEQYLESCASDSSFQMSPALYGSVFELFKKLRPHRVG